MTNPLTKITNKIGIDAQAIVWGCLAVGCTYIAGTAAAENYLTANGFSKTNDNNLAFVYTVQRSILPWVAVGNGLISCVASASKKLNKRQLAKYFESAYSQGDIGQTAYEVLLNEVEKTDG